jgi:hypothetical protein
MRRERVESDVIVSMGYDPVWRVLEIEFSATREIYDYFEVPAEEYAAFCAAESKGTYLNTTFKARGYRFVRKNKRPTCFDLRIAIRRSASLTRCIRSGRRNACGVVCAQWACCR